MTTSFFFSCHEELKKINMPQYAQKVLEGAVVGCLRQKYRESAHNGIELGAQCKQEVDFSCFFFLHLAVMYLISCLLLLVVVVKGTIIFVLFMVLFFCRSLKLLWKQSLTLNSTYLFTTHVRKQLSGTALLRSFRR